jgi:hypothetical protein
MPFYTYKHPNTGETIDVMQSMAEEHVFIDAEGTKWERVFYPTSFAFDTKIDPHDPKAFIKKTEKGGTIGDITDLSAEMKERRGGEKNDEVSLKHKIDKEKKLNKRKLENLREERKKQFEEFKKIDTLRVKPTKKNVSRKKKS